MDHRLDSAGGGEDSDAAADDDNNDGSPGGGDGSSDSDEDEGDGIADLSGGQKLSGGSTEFGLDSDSDEAETEDVKLASGRNMGNGSARGATKEAAAAAGIDVEGSEAASDGSDSEDGSPVDDESDEASDDVADDGVMEAAAAERRQSSAAATASGRPATGVLLHAAGRSSGASGCRQSRTTITMMTVVVYRCLPTHPFAVP